MTRGARQAPDRPRPLVRAAPDIGGVIEVRGVLGHALRELGVRIVRGDWAPDEALPREADLCAALGVSRSVVREAFRILGAKGMIRSRTSDGTRVLPRAGWRLLDPDVMDWRIRAGDHRALLLELMRVREVLEPGVVHAATRLAGPDARGAVRAAWAAKTAVYATPAADPLERRQAFIDADLAFHRALLAAVGSPLLDQLFAVTEAALSLLIDLQLRARGYVTEMVGMEEGQALHEAVFAAFEQGDPEGAERATRRLLDAALRDAEAGLAAEERRAREAPLAHAAGSRGVDRPPASR